MKLIAATLALLLASAFPLLAQETNWDARLGAVSGDVTIFPADGSPETSGEAGMPLEQGDRVVVGDGGAAEVALDGTSLIVVRANSDLKLEKTAKGDSTFFLAVGSLLAKIQKLGTQSLRVRTPTAVAAVRGTEFGVETDGEASHVGVFDDGKVEVEGLAGGKPELLRANQETSVLKGAGPGHAVQLQRFVARRAQMRAQGRRLAALKTKWKALPPAERRAARAKAIERMRENRKKLIEKRSAIKKEAEDRRRQNLQKNQQRRQEDLRKMEERRKKARGNRP
ncbi:MAG: FecR domain-containing protein [Elusimicrobiota bacterium]|nr:FecR domain-containing protein [Elusimicrobiota bacterium]